MQTATLLGTLVATAYAAWCFLNAPESLNPTYLSLLLLAIALHAWQAAYPPKKHAWLPPALLLLLLAPASVASPVFSMLLPVPLCMFLSQIHTLGDTGSVRQPMPVWVAGWLSVLLPLGLTPLPSWPDTFAFGGLQLLVHLLAMDKATEKRRLTEETDRLRAQIQDQARRQAQDGAYRRQEMENVQLEERNRLAQTLHDRIGHTISASLMQLEAIRALMPIQPERTLPMLDHVLSTLRNGLDAIRETLRNLKPAQEELGVNRVRLLLDDFGAKNGLKVHFTCSGDLVRILPHIWKTLLDNLNEALTNILRHARRDGPPLSVTADISVLNRMLRVTIRDNGPGCALIKKGLGLRGMEERLAAHDGRLILDGSSGFSLIMLFPLEQDT